jgi:mannosyltransferase
VHAGAPGPIPLRRLFQRDEGGVGLQWILAISIVLRANVGAELWLDEILMLHDYARAPLAKVATSYPNDNNHPLYSLLASLLVKLFGEHPSVLRAPALLFGLLAIPATYVFARRFATRIPALAAAMLIGFSYHAVWFSLNARGYTALLLSTLIATEAFLRSREGAKRAWIAHAFALGLGTYAHLTCVFVGVAHAIVQLLFPSVGGRKAAAPWKGIFGGGALAALLHAPMASDLWTFFVARPDRVAVASEWKSPMTQALSALTSLGFGSPIAGGVLLSLGALIGAIGLWSMLRRDRAALVAAFLPPILGAATTLLLGRHLWPRFFFFAFGFAAVVAALGLACVFRRKTDVAAAIVAVPLAIGGAYGGGQKQDFRSPLALIASLERDEARSDSTKSEVYTVGLAMWPYKYLHRPDWIPVALDADDRPVDDPAPLLAAIKRARESRRNVYVVSCSPIFLRSRQPKIAAVMDANSEILHISSPEDPDIPSGPSVYVGTAGEELAVVVRQLRTSSNGR